MSTKQPERHINKSSWPNGSWMSEPDDLQWVDEVTECECRIIRNSHSGGLNGYVRVKEEHPWYGLEYTARVAIKPVSAETSVEDIGIINVVCRLLKQVDEDPSRLYEIAEAVAVHGGLTFSGELRGFGGWWFGFDNHHAWDYAPGMPLIFGDEDCVYRDIDYVKENVNRLALQLFEARVAMKIRSVSSKLPEVNDE